MVRARTRSNINLAGRADRLAAAARGKSPFLPPFPFFYPTFVFLPRPPFFYPALRFFSPPSLFFPRLPFFYPALRFFTPPGLLGLCVRTMISQLENVSLVMGEDSDFDAPLFVVLSIPCILASSTR